MIDKKNTINWCLAWLAVIVLLVVAIIINEAHQGTTSEQLESGIITDNGDLKINWDRYNTFDVELSETYTITGSGVYHFTGELSNGSIVINTNSEAKVKLILDNVTIKNSAGPAIICYAADDLVIELIGENILEDSKTYDKSYDEDVKGAIYSKSDLTFQGEGTLNLTANYQDGIVGKDDLKFNSGEYQFRRLASYLMQFAVKIRFILWVVILISPHEVMASNPPTLLPPARVLF